jgi:hypothetical protein
VASINVDDLQTAVEDILREYGDVVYEATEEGLNAAEKILMDNLKTASPKDSGGFAKSWKSKGKKYKLQRYVGNTKAVKGAKSDTIPLSNILEYSTKSKHRGFIKQTFENSVNNMAAAVVAEIRKEV